MTESTNERWWVRFYVKTDDLPHFEYHGPWWISGTTFEEPERSTVCAAVCAGNEDAARDVIAESFDDGYAVAEWSFTDQRADDWAPFCERFSRAEWMRWPWPEKPR